MDRKDDDADGGSKEDRARAVKEALEALRNARAWPVKGGEDGVEFIRRMRKEREDYLAARHKPRTK